MYDILKGKIDAFRERMENDERVQEFLGGRSRVVMIEIPDGESVHFSITPEGISELNKGTTEDADLTITANELILRGIINKEIKPLKAYIKKQLKLKAKEFKDILFIKKLF